MVLETPLCRSDAGKRSQISALDNHNETIFINYPHNGSPPAARATAQSGSGLAMIVASTWVVATTGAA
jgi:hypothetical protein